MAHSPVSLALLLLSTATSATRLSTTLPPPALRSDAGPGRAGVDAALECGVRALALDYATFLQPQADNQLVFDALRLGPDCNASFAAAGFAARRRR